MGRRVQAAVMLQIRYVRQFPAAQYYLGMSFLLPLHYAQHSYKFFVTPPPLGDINAARGKIHL
jgi:hypothetical protein